MDDSRSMRDVRRARFDALEEYFRRGVVRAQELEVQAYCFFHDADADVCPCAAADGHDGGAP